MQYHNTGRLQLTECHDCGKVTDCEVLVADSPEPETGYVDEYALCAKCLYGDAP